MIIGDQSRIGTQGSDMPKRFRAIAALLLALPLASALARPVNVLTPELRRVLREGKGTLPGVSLRDEKLDTIELEPMEVWAKDAKIIVHGPAGEETISPPAVKYFKGRITGEPDSAVFVSMSDDGSIRGMILMGERRWHVGSGVHKAGRPARDGETPILISEADEIDELSDPAANWSCAATGAGGMPHIRARELSMKQKPLPNAGNVSGATYQLRIAIETDNEFCAAFGNNNTTITTYIGDLLGKASIVYQRDLKTTLVIGFVNLTWTSMTDPWTVTPSTPNPGDSALAEFGAYWHSNYPLASVPRSSAVFLSGKSFGGGIAWIGDMLCGDDFFCGADTTTATNNCGSPAYVNSYAGAYAFIGSIGSPETSVPDPTLTQNGVQYGMPTTNFNMLQGFMHELGHNANGPHTHCVALTAPEKALYGVTRNYVDECAQQGGCFIGSTSVPAEKGTTMSYCNLTSSGGYPNSRYLFGKAGEPSEKMLALFHTALETITPNGTITTQTPPVACSAGRTASVPSCGGCTYAWQISGGTITSATNTSAITYTPTLSSVTLTATIIAARGCGITASKTISTSCAALQPPTNVVATATGTTTVGVSWTASAGATTYNVYRSPSGLTSFSLAGSSGTTSFGDTGRSPNTAYLYKVRAVNGGESGDSNIDLATTVIFTDDPLVNNTTLVKIAHITELRTAVNAVRTLAGLSGGTYTDPGLTVNTSIKRQHITDLRSALDAARSLLTLSALSYGETITAGTTTIKASHVTELRNGVK
jgi:hypothetical protein